MKIQYFRETNGGDYGAIDKDTFDGDQYEGRSTVIQGDPSSICTGAIGLDFLKKCTRPVLAKYVPQEWRKEIDGGGR